MVGSGRGISTVGDPGRSITIAGRSISTIGDPGRGISIAGGIPHLSPAFIHILNNVCVYNNKKILIVLRKRSTGK